MDCHSAGTQPYIPREEQAEIFPGTYLVACVVTVNEMIDSCRQ